MRPMSLTATRLGVHSVITILIVITLLSIFQRILFRRSGLKPVSPEIGSFDLPSAMRLSVFKASPEAYSEDTYQLAYIVKSLRPNSILEGRRLVDGPAGQVSIGLAEGGRLELQTCLMDSGRSAVTNQRMVEENLQSAEADPSRRLIWMLQGVLLGRPLTSRPCLLVQLRLNEPIADTQQSRGVAEESLLKEAWPLLQSLAPVRERELF
jgi:hypothetical protein